MLFPTNETHQQAALFFVKVHYVPVFSNIEDDNTCSMKQVLVSIKIKIYNEQIWLELST